MSAAYIRELAHARRDVRELDLLLAFDDELTVHQLAQAIGLAGTAYRGLLAAMKARHTDEGAG